MWAWPTGFPNNSHQTAVNLYGQCSLTASHPDYSILLRAVSCSLVRNLNPNFNHNHLLLANIRNLQSACRGRSGSTHFTLFSNLMLAEETHMDPQNTDLSANAKMFNQAKTLRLHTGNLVNRSRLKRKCPSSPSEELQDCIKATLTDWFSLPKSTSEDFADTLDCSIPQATDAITPEEREELKVSAKLFLCEPVQSSIREAVEMACQTLAVSQLDSVIIAPPGPPEGDSQTLANLQPAWEELEALVRCQQIAAIGTSDLDKDLLEQLYNWAQVKPSSNQVNLASCCVMPPDLTAFAKDFDIQLLTHNDPKELMSAAAFQEALQEGTQDLNMANWRLEWVLRYSIIVKSRGIIKAKGYLVSARKASP